MHTCRCVFDNRERAVTYFPNADWDRPLLLCTTHADLHRRGVTFGVFPLVSKESK